MDEPEWYVACKSGNMARLKQLLTRDNINTLEYKGWRPVFRAAAANYYGFADLYETVFWMLSELRADASGVSPPDKYNGERLPMIQLVPFDWPDIIPYLIRAGSDIDAVITWDDPIRRGVTLLSFALSHAGITIVPALIKYGALLSNVDATTMIPEYASRLAAGREDCKHATLLLIGLRRYRRAPLLVACADAGVVRLIAAHVWETRVDGMWHSKKA